MKTKYRYIIGVDEVGRGPVAGPVTVGAVCIHRDFHHSFFKGIKDSKKLSAKKREEWIQKSKKENIKFSITSIASKTIDKIGINPSIFLAIKKTLQKININPKDCLVLLDGGLRAPEEYLNQKTIIKGDEKKSVIALASIFAKVDRDKKMEKFSRVYKNYFFEKNKGYGTSLHIKKIVDFGLCKIHRRTFLNKIF
jgi:ribonuclease HII